MLGVVAVHIARRPGGPLNVRRVNASE
jgi:hypothetical protein